MSSQHMSSQHIVDRFNSSPKKPINKLYKVCPMCHGSGTNTPIMMVDILGMPNNNKPNKRPSLFTCKTCSGSGRIPLIDLPMD